MSTGWADDTLVASNDELDGVLRTERIFKRFRLSSLLPNSNSALTKVVVRLVVTFSSIDIHVTRPRTHLFFHPEPNLRWHLAWLVTLVAFVYTVAPSSRLGSGRLLRLEAIVDPLKMVSRGKKGRKTRPTYINFC